MAHLRARSYSPEEDDPDPDGGLVTGTGTLQSAKVTWTGDTSGASTATNTSAAGAAVMGFPRGNTENGGLLGGRGMGGGGATRGIGGGGTGVGGTGGAGGSRPGSSGDHSKHQLKMSFPRFNGDQPRIWKDKCLDYFRLFNVHASLWLVSCTLHMDGNAALWFKAYRLRHEVNTWTELMQAVEEKFGADDYRRYLKQLLALKQKGTVEEYQLQFEELSYQIAIQNPHYDDQFYVLRLLSYRSRFSRKTLRNREFSFFKIFNFHSRFLSHMVVQRQFITGVKVFYM
jgi:hypothetical protein